MPINFNNNGSGIAYALERSGALGYYHIRGYLGPNATGKFFKICKLKKRIDSSNGGMITIRGVAGNFGKGQKFDISIGTRNDHREELNIHENMEEVTDPCVEIFVNREEDGFYTVCMRAWNDYFAYNFEFLNNELCVAECYLPPSGYYVGDEEWKSFLYEDFDENYRLKTDVIYSTLGTWTFGTEHLFEGLKVTATCSKQNTFKCVFANEHGKGIFTVSESNKIFTTEWGEEYNTSFVSGFDYYSVDVYYKDKLIYNNYTEDIIFLEELFDVSIIDKTYSNGYFTGHLTLGWKEGNPPGIGENEVLCRIEDDDDLQTESSYYWEYYMPVVEEYFETSVADEYGYCDYSVEIYYNDTCVTGWVESIEAPK